MERKSIAKAGPVTLGCSVLVVFLASTGFAGKSGDHAAESSPTDRCGGAAFAFPSSVHTRLYRGMNGSLSGFEIHLASADGECSAMLYSSNAAEGGISLSFHQAPDDQVIVLR